MARVICALAAALFLAVPPTARADISQGHPTSSYTRSNDCALNSTKRAPVTVALERFPTKQAALDAIGAETGWSSPSVVVSQYLSLVTSLGGTQSECLGNETTARQLLLPSGSERTLMRLWGNDAVTAGTPVREKQAVCNGTSTWIAKPDGYNEGRYSFENAFQGSTSLGTTAYEGPYPVQLVYWGNTQPIQQCDGSAPSSDGSVTVIHPKDDFGVHERLQRSVLRQADSATMKHVGDCPLTNQNLASYGGIKEAVLQQWEDLGVTTIRFGLDWKSVAPCSAAGTDPTQWDWGLWDKVIPQLADPNDTHPDIHPIIVVKSPPPNIPGSPQWTDPLCPVDKGQGSALVNTAPNGGLAAWRSFVKQVASRYGDTAKAIEVWNEPNTPDYWGGCNTRVAGADGVDPVEKYLRILNVAGQGVTAAKQADPQIDVPLMLPGLKPADPPGLRERAWDDYLNRVLDNWHQNLLDQDTRAAVKSVGLHPYRTENDKKAGIDPAWSALTQFGDAEQIVADNSLNKPVWVTEVGTTHAGNPTGNTYVGSDPFVQGFTDWAIYDTLRNAGAPLTEIYRFADKPIPTDGEISDDSDFGYGVVKSSLAAKFGYCLLAQERTQVYPPNPPNTAC